MRFLLLLALLAAPFAAAQTVRQSVRATAEDGREVWLHPNGTWTVVGDEVELDLADTPPPPPAPPPPAPPPPAAPPRTFESASGVYTVRYDASRWRTSRAQLNQDSEFEFTLPMGAGYAITIYEVTPYSLDTMRDIVLEVPRVNLDADVTLIGEERIELGAIDGLRLEYRMVTPDGIDATFINTLYSDPRGTLQVLTWTSTAVMPRFRDELLRFQDGLTIIKAGR